MLTGQKLNLHSPVSDHIYLDLNLNLYFLIHFYADCNQLLLIYILSDC